MTAATAQVPATTRSGTVVWSAGCSVSTPCTASVEEPMPSMEAPIASSSRQMSMISGSRAALSMTVVPSAVTEAMRRFSVAPTLGKLQPHRGPAQPAFAGGDEEAVLAVHVRPEALEAGDVHVEAAAADVVAARQGDVGLPHRARSGPSTLIDARSLRTRS